MGRLGVGKGKRKWKKKKWRKPKSLAGQVRKKKVKMKEKKKKTLNWLKGIFGHSGEDAVKVHERGIYLGETVLSLKCLILGQIKGS